MTDNELLLALSDMMDKKLDSKLQPIKNDLCDLKQDVKDLKEDVAVLKEKVASLEDNVAALKEDVLELKENTAIVKWDIRAIKLDSTALREDVTTVRIDVEHTVKPQLYLLAENYVPAAKKYESETAKIASMQEDSDIIKKVVTEHSKKIQTMA